MKRLAAAATFLCVLSAYAQPVVRPQLRTSDVAVAEGTGGVSWARFTATLDAPMGRNWFVFLSPHANATDVVPNQPRPIGFQFASSQTIATADVPLQADSEPEPDEVILMTFSNYTDPNGPSFERSEATLTIINDDIGLGPVDLRTTLGAPMSFPIDLGNPLAAGDTLTVTPADPEVVTVTASVAIGSSTGEITLTGLREGHTRLVAEVIRPAGPARGETDVTVFQPSVLVAMPNTVRLRVGEEVTTRVSFSPAQGVPMLIDVQSSSTGIVQVLPALVSVSAGGDAVITLRGLAPGRTLLKFLAHGQQHSTVVPVEVVPNPGRRRSARP